MDKITDKVYLSDCFEADKEDQLLKNNIKRVYSCCGSLSCTYSDKSIIQKRIEIEDSSEANIIKYFKDALKFIDASDKVLVHCFAGVSRSATLVIAYFMWKNKKPYKEMYEFVNKHRSIGPNFGFRKQLLIFESKLKAANYDLDKINIFYYI
jgi:protein-tyrosine phosphatase